MNVAIGDKGITTHCILNAKSASLFHIVWLKNSRLTLM